MPPARKRASRQPSDSSPGSIAIITSVYNATVTSELERGALRAFATSEIAAALGLAIETYHVAGSFELIPAVAMAAEEDRILGVVALGCIIKGETNHDAVLGHSVTQALANITLQTLVPIGLGVLTVNSQAQALARAGLGKNPQGNKGAEAMDAVLTTLRTMLAIAREESTVAASITSHDKLVSDKPASNKQRRR